MITFKPVSKLLYEISKEISLLFLSFNDSNLLLFERSISDIELEIDSVDYDSDEFDINLDESKFNPIDNDEEVEIECVKTNINGTEYYWNNQTNDLYDLNEKLIGKIMGNGKIVYNDTKLN